MDLDAYLDFLDEIDRQVEEKTAPYNRIFISAASRCLNRPILRVSDVRSEKDGPSWVVRFTAWVSPSKKETFTLPFSRLAKELREPIHS